MPQHKSIWACILRLRAKEKTLESDTTTKHDQQLHMQIGYLAHRRISLSREGESGRKLNKEAENNEIARRGPLSMMRLERTRVSQ